MSLDVLFVNESTMLSDEEAFQTAWACNLQVRRDAKAWRSDVRCLYVPKGVSPTILSSHAVVHFLDNSDVQGALGYHDEDGNEIPYARVFVETLKQSGDPVSECASHELLELVADPHVYLAAPTGDLSRWYAHEVGDPVQGTGYDVGAPDGKTYGIQVANFALPAYFDPNSKAEKLDFRGVLVEPFSIAPQGYMAYVDSSNIAAGWQQAFGSERKGSPDPDGDDRHSRRLGRLS